MLKLKFQYFGHLMLRTDSLEKTRMLGKIEGRRRRGRWRMRWLDSITNSMDMNLSKLYWIYIDDFLFFWNSGGIQHDWFYLLLTLLRLFKGIMPTVQALTRYQTKVLMIGERKKTQKWVFLKASFLVLTATEKRKLLTAIRRTSHFIGKP